MSVIKERPILFSAPMVRVLLSGAKTQTRRLVNVLGRGAALGHALAGMEAWWSGRGERSWSGGGVVWTNGTDTSVVPATCPYGAVGDRLWVRETWQKFDPEVDPIDPARLGPACPLPGCENDRLIHWRAAYRADGELSHPEHGPATWRPSIFMPRWASRILLEVTEVRVQRLQEISEADAQAEGISGPHDVGYRAFGVPGDNKPRYSSAVAAFEALWDDVNGERAPWSSSPWVWCVSLRRVEPK